MSSVMHKVLPALQARGNISPVIVIERAGIVLLTMLGLLYVVLDNDSFFNFWTDRDMVRSEMLLKEFQWMGAELSYGSAARVPGGALHYLWVIPTLFSKDPQLSYQFCVLLGMLSLIPFYWAMRRSFGPAAAVTSTAVLIASPILFGTLTRLWNPSFQAPFIILTFAFLVRLLGEGHKGSFKWMVAALVLGMQMHLSTYLLVMCVVLALVMTRTRIPLREAALAVLITLALLAPYLIGEFATSWDNVRQMFGSQGRGAMRSASLTRGVTYNPDNVGDVWRWYMLAFGMNDNLPATPLSTLLSWGLNLALLVGGLYTVLALTYWLEWGKPIAHWLGIACGGPHARVLVAAIIPVLVGFLYFSYSPQVELVIYGSARYLMFAIPGLAIIAGLGAEALVAAAGNRRVLQTGAGLIVAAGVAMPAWALGDSLRALDKPWNEPGRDFMGSLDQVAREMKWGLADTVARTTVLRRHDATDDRWRFENIFGIGYELHRYQMPQPFARKGECAAYLTGGARVYSDGPMSREALMRSFEQPGLKLEIVRQKRMVSDLLVVYRRLDGPGYCLTTVSNRYVLTDEEKAMFARYGKIAVGTAEATTAAADNVTRAFTLNLGGWETGPGIYAMLKFKHQDGRLELELHSNQLRGDTYNGGFLDLGMISKARVTLRSPERGTFTIDIEPGFIGGKGTFTPIQVSNSVPAGVYDVVFEADTFPPVKLGTWPVDFTKAKPVKVPVATQLKLGTVE